MPEKILSMGPTVNKVNSNKTKTAKCEKTRKNVMGQIYNKA